MFYYTTYLLFVTVNSFKYTAVIRGIAQGTRAWPFLLLIYTVASNNYLYNFITIVNNCIHIPESSIYIYIYTYIHILINLATDSHIIHVPL